MPLNWLIAQRYKGHGPIVQGSWRLPWALLKFEASTRPSAARGTTICFSRTWPGMEYCRTWRGGSLVSSPRISRSADKED